MVFLSGLIDRVAGRIGLVVLLATLVSLASAGCRRPPTVELTTASVDSMARIRPLSARLVGGLPSEVAEVSSFTSYSQFLAFEARLAARHRTADLVELYENVIRHGDKRGLAAARQVALLFQMNVGAMARDLLRTRLIQNPRNMALRAVVAVMMEPQATSIERLKDLLLFWRTALTQDPHFHTPAGEGPASIKKRIARLQATLDRKLEVERRKTTSTRPSSRPTSGPSSRPTKGPSSRPTKGPSSRPTKGPSSRPTSPRVKK
ncbi:MAG: PT domain-containing protein [Myxococcales bacterium]|nr:PT domain-containing protein [Myxococcales bacterium]